MNNVPLYNSVIIKTYLEYLENNYPNLDIDHILKHARISRYEIEDRGHWLTQEQVNRFQECAKIMTNNPQVAKEAGRYIASPNSSSIIRQSLTGFLTPSIAYWAVEKMGPSISRHINIKCEKLDKNSMQIIARTKDNINEQFFQCENRIGMLEAIPEVFSHRFAKVEHPECLHRGDDCCRYVATWEMPNSFKWRRLGSYFLMLSIISSIPLFFVFTFDIWIILTLVLLLLSMGTLFFSNILHINEISSMLQDKGKASDQIIEQINLRYSETLLIREIGEAASRILEPEILLKYISEALNKRLHFSRGMIMLTNIERTRLVYVSGYGYNANEENIINEANFSLDNPNSKGIFYTAFFNQEPFIVNNVTDITSNLSDKTIKFIKDLKVKSFICVPVIYEGKSEGILAVDNSKSESPATQSDLSLLTGIAQQIGISLNNARAHKKLKESEERFRSLSNNAPDIIYRTNIDGYITYVNPSWEELLGHKHSETQDNPLVGFVRFEEQQNFQKVLFDIINKQITIRDQNFIFLNNKGLPRYMTFTGAPDLDAEGNVIGVAGTLKDITKLRSMESQLLQASKLEAIGTLTGGVAHDFNNIIQAIMGYNQIMMTGRKDSETQKKYLENVKELILRSRELVQQLLLYGRKSDSELKPVNINEEIDNMNKLLSKSIPKMIKIRTNLSNNLLPVMSDPNQIGQILMNLVINARDALGDSGTITISTKNVDLSKTDNYSDKIIVPGYYVSFSVSDTGCGMDKDVFQHIFEPFFTTKEVGKGTGLGLSVVQGIVDNLKGYIFCNSVPDNGTTFEILLPATEEYAVESAAKEQPQKIKRGKERLLIVDDESYVLESVKESLSSYGYKVMTADSTDQALSLYSENKEKINLILLDLNMPGHGGKKCLTDLLSISKSAKILMTSGYSTAQQIDDLLQSGASGFIVKPYRTEELISSIRNILDRHFN